VLRYDRYQVVVWHGEHATVYYVVDTIQPDDKQPYVIHSYSTDKEYNAKFLAEDFCLRHNAKEKQGVAWRYLKKIKFW